MVEHFNKEEGQEIIRQLIADLKAEARLVGKGKGKGDESMDG